MGLANRFRLGAGRARAISLLSAIAVLAMTFAPCRGAVAGDTVFVAGFESASAAIAEIRAAADGALRIPVGGAVVTYPKPAIGGDPAGFFIQEQQAGPAVFVAVDPASLQPAAAVGDRVFLVATAVSTFNGLREVTALDAYLRVASGVPVAGLVQPVSNAGDLVSNLDGYESELVAISGTLASGFSASGSGFETAQLQTAAIMSPSLALRVPQALVDTLDLVATCSVTTSGVPMWRFATQAQPSPNTLDDIVALQCPAPVVAGAVALSATSVRVEFDRNIDPGSVASDGSQFVFDNGLVASAASVSGRDVFVTTSTQSGATVYTVVVAGVTDLLGSAVNPANDSAQFAGYVLRAGLRLNEIGAAISSSHDLVELVVTSAGSTSGAKLVEMNSPSNTILATLPDIAVAVNDLIVVHLNATDACVETTAKNQCPSTTYTSFYDTAWDVVGGTTGIAYSNRVLAVIDASDAILDAVAFALPASPAPPAAFPGLVQYIQSIGQWLPANCGGLPCDYLSTPTVVAISADWTGLGTTTAGKSVARKASTDTNQASDWAVGNPTWGVANP